MIYEVLFHQVPIQEEDDPQIEIHPCVTSFIKDLPQEIQERLQACKGSRKVTQKRFNIANKVVQGESN